MSCRAAVIGTSRTACGGAAHRACLEARRESSLNRFTDSQGVSTSRRERARARRGRLRWLLQARELPLPPHAQRRPIRTGRGYRSSTRDSGGARHAARACGRSVRPSSPCRAAVASTASRTSWSTIAVPPRRGWRICGHSAIAASRSTASRSARTWPSVGRRTGRRPAPKRIAIEAGLVGSGRACPGTCWCWDSTTSRRRLSVPRGLTTIRQPLRSAWSRRSKPMRGRP